MTTNSINSVSSSHGTENESQHMQSNPYQPPASSNVEVGTETSDNRLPNHAPASLPGLGSGIILLLGGLFGIYYQGPFWASGVVAAMNPDEDALALGLPSGVTLAGAFLVSYVLLASPLTGHWSLRRRTFVFAVFSLGVLVACGIAAWLAGQVAGKTLQTTEVPSNENRYPTFLRTRSWFTSGLCLTSRDNGTLS